MEMRLSFTHKMVIVVFFMVLSFTLGILGNILFLGPSLHGNVAEHIEALVKMRVEAGRNPIADEVRYRLCDILLNSGVYDKKTANEFMDIQAQAVNAMGASGSVTVASVERNSERGIRNFMAAEGIPEIRFVTFGSWSWSTIYIFTRDLDKINKFATRENLSFKVSSHWIPRVRAKEQDRAD